MTAAAARIALVGAFPFPSPQGSQVFVEQMAEKLASAGHDVHLLTYGQGAERAGRGYRHHRIARLPGDDARRSGPSAMKPLLDAMLAWRLISVVREHGIEIVHAHNYEAAIAALVARTRTRVPVVYHSHNLMGDELETYFQSGAARRAASLAGAFLDRSVPRRADHTIALCEWSAARLREAGCTGSRLSVIPPALDDDGALETTAEVRGDLGLAPGDFVVGYVGNLDAYQNLPLLFAAAERLVTRPSSQPAPLRVLIASHQMSTELRSMAEGAALGDVLRLVEVHGHTEARRALAACDVVALPRRLGSGYPVKLLNAMSAAKAVVAAGCGSKVLRDGIDGFIVPDDDPGALADALDRCRRDPARREALGKAARRTFLENMTWQQVLPQIEGVYAGLRERAGRQDRREP